jgi:hypothetical protein
MNTYDFLFIMLLQASLRLLSKLLLPNIPFRLDSFIIRNQSDFEGLCEILKFS